MDYAILAVLIIALCLNFILATIPGMIARGNGHANPSSVNLLGLLGMMIPPLWIAALVWAFVGAKPTRTSGYSGLRRVSAESIETTDLGSIEREIERRGYEFLVRHLQTGERSRLRVHGKPLEDARFEIVEKGFEVLAVRECNAKL